MQWGTEAKTNLKFWAEKGIKAIKDLVKEDGNRWKSFPEFTVLRRSVTSPHMYHRILHSIPWQPIPIIPAMRGLWIASKEEDGRIRIVYHISKSNSEEITSYTRLPTEQLQLLERNCLLPVGQYCEVRIIRCGGEKRKVLEFNPQVLDDQELTLWMWGED